MENSEAYEVRMKAINKGFSLTMRGKEEAVVTMYVKHYDGRWTVRRGGGMIRAVNEPETILKLEALMDGYIALSEGL